MERDKERERLSTLRALLESKGESATEVLAYLRECDAAQAGRAWRGIRALRDPGAFGGWLKRVAVNEWLAEARRVPAPIDDEAGVARLALSRDGCRASGTELTGQFSTRSPATRRKSRPLFVTRVTPSARA